MTSRRRRRAQARRDYFRQQSVEAIQALRQPFIDGRPIGLPPDQDVPLTVHGREVGRVSNLRTFDGDIIGEVSFPPTDGWLMADERPEFAPEARIDVVTRYGEIRHAIEPDSLPWHTILQYRPAANRALAGLAEALERITPADLDDVVDALQSGAPVEQGMRWWTHSVNSWGGFDQGGWAIPAEPNSRPLEPWPERRPEPVELPGSRVVAYARFEEFPSPPPEANRDCGHVDLSTGLGYYWTGMAWAQEADEGMNLNPARRALASVLRREEVAGAPEPTPVEPIKTKRQVRF